MGCFEDKVAIVTGGGAGIGEAVCRELARRGALVTVADINGDDAERVTTTIASSGGRAQACRVDVADEQDIRRLVEQTAAAHGRLDYLFNNAGIAIGGDARDLTSDQWRRVLDVDLYGVLNGTVAAYPIMARQGSGHIVNISSATGLLPQPLNAPYCTAKHAVVGLSLSLRLEGADLGVKVSAVCPGYVRTNIYQNVLLVNMPREEAARKPVKMIEPSQAAVTILDGVARNRALIIFPGYVRWAWRGYRLFPRAIERVFVLRMRQLRKYRTAAE
ncbi:MAG TPA: SDR family oxidoreductase [Mycobacterium sp.]|nr:SDR family oxidoreductase [Mycobacterium sp.]HUH72589.1 SDR family oxidoreductase [Mycobacterium sp.]